MSRTRADVAGLAVSGLVVAVPAFVLVNLQSTVGRALLAAGIAGLGMISAVLVWMGFGRPPYDRMLRDHPAISLLCLACLILGLIPAVVWT